MSEHRVLTLEDLRRALDTRQGREIVRVSCPTLGGEVCIRGLTATERDAYEVGEILARKARDGERGAIGLRARTVRAHLCDEKGARLVGPDEPADWLGDLPAADMDKVFTACMRLSAITAEDVEELEGN